MRIGIDVDGVLRDFISAFKKVVGQEHPDVVFPEIISSWKFENDITGLTRDELKEIYKHKFSRECFEEALPFPEVVPAFWTLEKWAEQNGHELIIVTSQFKGNFHHTLTWLGKYGINFQTVYFRKGMKKWMVECDYLIDDSPNNWKHWKNGRGGDKNFLLMNQKWNEKINSTNRVNSIKEAIELINAQ